MNKNKTGLLFLYNALYAISSSYKDLEYLESPIFNIMDEIDSCISAGFCEQALSNYSKGGLHDELVSEIGEFGKCVSRIENEYWNPYDFDNYEGWRSARDWAKSLRKKLGMMNKGWYNSGSIVLWTDK